MKFIPTKLPGVTIVEPTVFEDNRGYFFEFFHTDKFAAAGLPATFLQDNHSRSKAGTVRGLHYQLPPHAQGKLVRTLSGEIFDVAVDIRKSSPTFGQWVGEVLSEENKRQLWVPEGFAHGFQVLSESAVVNYKCTNVYAPDLERSIRWNDPDIAVDWPEDTAHVSQKDEIAPLLSQQADLAL